MELNFRLVNSNLLSIKVALAIICCLSSIIIVICLAKYSHYGIDFTDESFYLVWISNPYIYDVSITQFGFIYHPLYLLFDGDISSLRQSNIFITFGLAFYLGYLLLESLVPKNNDHLIILLVISSGLATSALIVFDYWIVTPSYNSLALQSLLITGIGLLLAGKNITLGSVFGWVVVGVGGWLSFMAKPSTALALALGTLLFLLVGGRLFIRMILISIATALILLVISALVIDGSVLEFIDRVLSGIEHAGYLGGRHTLVEISRIDEFTLNLKSKYAIGLAFFVTFFGTWFALCSSVVGKIFLVLVSLVLAVIVGLLVSGFIYTTAELGQFQGLLMSGLLFGSVASCIVFGRLKGLVGIDNWQWAAVIFFLLSPYIYAFGTNNNYWQVGGSAVVFWLYCAVIFLAPLARSKASWFSAFPLVISGQVVTAILLQSGLEQPYRQDQPLRLNNKVTNFGTGNSTLVLSEGYAKYLELVNAAALQSGFEASTPVIDLTGQSPGVLFALQAESIGQAWTIGGYPGSLDLVNAALSLVDCQKIATAWVLYEPEGPRAIPLEALYKQGLDFPDSYRQVGNWATAKGAGGYPESRMQILYSPITPATTLSACQKARTGSRI